MNRHRASCFFSGSPAIFIAVGELTTPEYFMQVILGHAKADVTQVYAEHDEAKAIEVSYSVAGTLTGPRISAL